ncbi:MAG: carbon starvation protein A, partial [Fusobacteria bacterium]
FFISIVLLVLGYLIYGKFVEKVFGIDPNAETPAVKLEDGVDFIPLPVWKIFMIQFLNIAGLGPIFGAIAGALFGPVAFIWIVIGSIFAGGVHDYMSGMLSLRNDGKSVPELVGKYLGNSYRMAMRFISVILLVLVGVVFVAGPATILHGLTGLNVQVLVYIIFAYYLIATLVPVDKIIAKIYPLFGAALLFMAAGVGVMLFVKGYKIPELFGNMTNMQANPMKTPIFPMLFITIACGAISGFHSTQAPLMARCITNEKQGRSVFYGSMIAEGVVALVWAAAAMSFFGGIKGLAGFDGNAAAIVNVISNSLLGKVGGALAVFGVVAAPITSGDTAFRSARLTIADALNFEQHSMKNRLLVAIPLFVIGFFLSKVDFNIVWRYFGFTNQLIATIVLWTATAYFAIEKKNFWITFIPSVFMTSVCIAFIMMAPIGFGLPVMMSKYSGIVLALVIGATFLATKNKVYTKENLAKKSI